MAVFTDLNLKEARSLAAAYGLRIERIEPLPQGQSRSNYLLYGPAGRFVLTIGAGLAIEGSVAVASLLAALHARGVRVPRVLETTSGDLVVFHDGHPVTLKAFVEGEVARGLRPSALTAVGVELARVHEVPVPADLPELHAYGVEAFAEILADPPADPFAGWLARREREIGELPFSALPNGLIHGDLFYDNVVTRNGELAALLDFELACRQPFVFDLGMAIVGCCHDGDGLVLGDAAKLVAGYASHSPLGSAERRHLQAFVVYAAASTAFWRFRQYRIRRPGHANQDTYLEMQAIADRVRTMGPSEFEAAVFGRARP